jgi:hypothetical protein
MTNTKPAYFDEIRQEAEDCWNLLESNRKVAGPWHHLFSQIQDPRHVISELLQNADDAEATEVFINITNGIFTFYHNGRDFSADDFASLCGFGHSNKLTLHTIGFRGIGFKSTFSLGDTVGLRTPTLRVAFRKDRFTLPVWINDETAKDKHTQILVKIADEKRQKQLLNNMQEWLNNPFSLLFFNHIRRVKLGDQDLNWKSLGAGPISNSEWMGLQNHETPYLVVRSLDEPFPEEALKEIREEHLNELAENTSLPPCKVEIVLGAPGDLFVVLPTSVRTPLPFASNAPFVQDPARLKVKDPDISPTNHWLLERIGKLAASAMLQWLETKELETKERARAYDLLPAPIERNNTLESNCAKIVGGEAVQLIHNKPFVLADNGTLEMAKQCCQLPPVLWEIWTSIQIASLLRVKLENSRILSNELSRENQQKLQDYNAVSLLDSDAFLDILTTQTPPKPKTWPALLALWNLASEWKGYYWKKIEDLGIHPVRGKKFLFSAKSVVRLGEKKLLQSEEDWDFLSADLLVLDVNWLRYLTEQRRIATETNDEELAEKVENADRLLQRTNLAEPNNLDEIIQQLATSFFEEDAPKPADCIRFTQIAAKLNAKTGNAFRFLTRDGVFKPIKDNIIFDENGKLEDFIPPNYRKSNFLGDGYTREYKSCSKKDWLHWIILGNSGLLTHIPTIARTIFFRSRKELEDAVKARGFTGALNYKYAHQDYRCEDLDYPDDYWDYWESCAETDPAFWGRLVESLLHQPEELEGTLSANVCEVAINLRYQNFPTGPLTPGWILRFRELPCLRDTHGQYRLPAELMRRTPQTEPLLDLEPFVDASLDVDKVRPLLDLLGVRNIPSGPKQIIDRLRALAKAPKPPLLELTKWYQRLDTLYDNCTTKDQEKIRSAFQLERLIFTEECTWETADSIYITSNENDAPGAALIHSDVNKLSLWAKINVNERPTVELALKWIRGLPIGEKLPSADARRLRTLLGRYPVRIFQECRHWLNLSGEWIAFENISYSLSMLSLIRWANLHDWVKAETADLQMLRAEDIHELPFASWPSLASLIEKQIEQRIWSGHPVNLDWLHALGKLLIRIDMEDKSSNERIHGLAARLAKTEGRQVETLKIIPYLNGNPAGLPEDENIAWIEDILYITEMPKPRLIRLIPETIAGVFDWPDLKVILAYSYERSQEDILAYLNENYVLVPEEAVLPIEDVIETPGTAAEILPVIDNGDEKINQDELNLDPEGSNTEKNPKGVQKPIETPKQRHEKNPLIERFALARGFQNHNSHTYIHQNGNILSETNGVFPWQIQEPGGTVFRYYWIKEHCLQNKPLELTYEIWHLIEEHPAQHALILVDRDGDPIEMLGIDLQRQKVAGTLKLFPATYRLTIVLED